MFQVKLRKRWARGRGSTEGEFSVNVGDTQQGRVWSMRLMSYWSCCYISDWDQRGLPDQPLSLRGIRGYSFLVQCFKGKVSRICFLVLWQKGKTSQFQVKYTDHPASTMPVKRKGFLQHIYPLSAIWPKCTTSLKLTPQNSVLANSLGGNLMLEKLGRLFDCGLLQVPFLNS